MPDAAARAMRHAYYSSVSWLDFQVGRVLNALKGQKVADSTTVVMHGDHGTVATSSTAYSQVTHAGNSRLCCCLFLRDAPLLYPPNLP